MNRETRNRSLLAWKYCDDNDKSTEFMLEYMQDFAKVNLDCVINFITDTTDKERIEFAEFSKSDESFSE